MYPRSIEYTLGAVRKTLLSSSKSSLSTEATDGLCCGSSPAGMSMDAVDAKAEPACSGAESHHSRYCQSPFSCRISVCVDDARLKRVSSSMM